MAEGNEDLAYRLSALSIRLGDVKGIIQAALIVLERETTSNRRIECVFGLLRVADREISLIDQQMPISEVANG